MNDFQGIGIGQTALHHLRESRMNAYQAVYRISDILDCTKVCGNQKYYNSSCYVSTYKPTFVHHQLRHLIHSPNDSAVYFTLNDEIKCWNPITNQTHTAIDLIKELKVQIHVTSLSATNDIVLAGGLHGELILKTNSGLKLIKLSTEMNSITNNILCCKNRRGVEQGILSNNDNCIRIMDLKTLEILKHFMLPWAPNVYVANVVLFVKF